MGRLDLRRMGQLRRAGRVRVQRWRGFGCGPGRSRAASAGGGRRSVRGVRGRPIPPRAFPRRDQRGRVRRSRRLSCGVLCRKERVRDLRARQYLRARVHASAARSAGALAVPRANPGGTDRVQRSNFDDRGTCHSGGPTARRSPRSHGGARRRLCCCRGCDARRGTAVRARQRRRSCSDSIRQRKREPASCAPGRFPNRSG